MKFEVYKDILFAHLGRDEAIRCESDGAVSLSPNMDVQGEMSGGVLSSFARSIFSGESFFQQILRARDGPGEATVAAKYTGDITVLDNVAGMPLLMRAGCFLAADENVQLTTQTQNLSMGLFSGNGMFILEAQGNGPLAFAAFGNVFKRELSEGQEILVDNGHIVAWDSSLQYKVEMANKTSMLSSMTSGEGLMCRFRGPGGVWIQSHNADNFRGWLHQGDKKGGGGGSIPPIAMFAFLAFFCCIVFVFVIVGIAIATGDQN